MKTVTIYTKPGCPYCVLATSLLDEKGVTYKEIIASQSPEKRAEMIKRAHGRKTFPQIFIGDIHVGGCDDLMASECNGELDTLLQDDAS